jgi:hypothetical protein
MPPLAPVSGDNFSDLFLIEDLDSFEECWSGIL